MSLKLLEIEHELTGSNSEEALARYDAVLVGLDNRLNEQLNTGLAPEDFARAEKLKEANMLARKLLRLAVKEGNNVPSASSGVIN